MGFTHMARGAGLSPQRSHQQLDPKSPSHLQNRRTTGPLSGFIRNTLRHPQHAPSAHPLRPDFPGCHRLLQAMVPPACALGLLCQHHQSGPDPHDHCLRCCFHASPSNAHHWYCTRLPGCSLQPGLLAFPCSGPSLISTLPESPTAGLLATLVLDLLAC